MENQNKRQSDEPQKNQEIKKADKESSQTQERKAPADQEGAEYRVENDKKSDKENTRT